jgi:hypothetical protein
MVGGKVIETILLDDRIWVNCRGTGSEHLDECAIYVERTPESESVSDGDSIWWQSQWAFWTPIQRGDIRPFHDKKLRRIGFSGVRRPEPVRTPSERETGEDT